MSTRKLNLQPEIQGVHIMFEDPLFFPAPLFLVQTSIYRIDQ